VADEERTFLDKTIGHYPWWQELALGVVVASAVKLLTLNSPGEPASTIGAIGAAWFALAVWGAAATFGHLGQAESEMRVGAFAGVVATLVIVAPLGFGIGRGELASVLLLVLGVLILVGGPRADRL